MTKQPMCDEQWLLIQDEARELLVATYGMLGYLEDGCSDDMTDLYTNMKVEELVEHIKKTNKYIKDLQDVVDAMNFDLGLIEGLRGVDVYRYHVDNIGKV